MASPHPALDGLLQRTRRRLVWHIRLEYGARAVFLGGVALAAAAIWRGVVAPGFPWMLAGGLGFLAGLLPVLVHGMARRVSLTTAAWYLDCKLEAEGRILTLSEEIQPGALKSESGFYTRLEEEVSPLLTGDWAPSLRRPGRVLISSAALVAASLVVLLLGGSEPTLIDEIPSPGEQARLHYQAARRVSERLNALGETEVGEALELEALRFQKGLSSNSETRRLARILEERLRHQDVLDSIRKAVGNSEAGKKVQERIFGGSGTGAAITSNTEEEVKLLEKAAGIPGLPEAVARHLQLAAEAARNKDLEASGVLTSRIRDLLDGEISASLLVEASELLAAMEAGDIAGGKGNRYGSPGRLPVKKAGPGGDPGVRVIPGVEAVLDPDLRRIIRRYFDRDNNHE